jgi:DNA mismatch repair protein MutS
MMITGPNMGGKSVYLKQTALLTVMAQAGSFVPAKTAQIPLTDKILTRIGAQDALSLGQSTFMVEMRETAHILASATPATLVLLDEVGRGTSTFDGISIAWAIAEYLYKPHGAGPRVLFATHYFELTELEAKYDKIKNFHVAVSEYKTPEGESKLNFLFEVRPGAADKSYGIHVAQIAGLPKSCILRATKILKDLGEKESTGIVKKEAQGPDLFSSPILEELKMVETDKITPLQAIQILAEWKKRLQ